MRIRDWRIAFFLLVLAGIAVPSICLSVDYEVDRSTNALSTSSLAIIAQTDPGDILGKVLINQRASIPETLKIYDSSGTANNLIGTIDLSTGTTTSGPNVFNEYLFALRLSSGVTISKSGPSSDITILWKNVR